MDPPSFRFPCCLAAQQPLAGAGCWRVVAGGRFELGLLDLATGLAQPGCAAGGVGIAHPAQRRGVGGSCPWRTNERFDAPSQCGPDAGCFALALAGCGRPAGSARRGIVGAGRPAAPALCGGRGARRRVGAAGSDAAGRPAGSAEPRLQRAGFEPGGAVCSGWSSPTAC